MRDRLPGAGPVVVASVSTVAFAIAGVTVVGRPPAGAITLGGALGMLAGLAVVLRDARRTHGRSTRLREALEALAEGGDTPSVVRTREDALGELELAVGRTSERVVARIRDLTMGQDRLRAILGGMVEGVVVTDLEGRVLLTNQRARELLDLSEDVVERRPVLVDVARAPAFVELMRELRRGASVVSRDVEFQGRPVRTVQMNAARLEAEAGESFGFVVVLHDVSELRRLEVVRRDFVANVSHELRTPLTAIKGYAETLLGPAGDDRDTARRFLRVVDRHSERLGRLIDDLLTLSDLELGRTPLRLGAVEVALAVDDVLQIFGEAKVRKGIELVADVAPDTPPITADGDRLRQVLINLVDNAIKYTPEGGCVTVTAGSADLRGTPAVCIAVRDTGVGVPARDLPRLTERFFRVDKARSREMGGTGLGLAIVKHIVQLHGGRLEIDSAVGQGTTVTAYWPAAGYERAPAAPDD